MLPSELPLNILLMGVIIIILIFYTILLVKLKPSKEAESPLNIYLERKKEPPIEPKRLEKPTTTAETKKITIEQPASPVETQKTPKESTESVQTKTQAETSEPEEEQEPKKGEEARKSFFLFGERNFEGCSHKFGYLSSLPKNTPIPDECFGCPQIVECLRTSKNR